MSSEVERSQAEWRSHWGEPEAVGEIGVRVLLENAHVRIWHLELGPGETSPLHTHSHPYLFVVLESARTETRFVDGELSEDADPVGAAVWAGLDEGTRTHTLRNVDSKRYVNRVIELLS